MSELRVNQYQPDCYYAIWKDLGANEAGASADIPISSSTRCVQIFSQDPEVEPPDPPDPVDPPVVIKGALPAGAKVAIIGSMDGVHWANLTDALGNSLEGVPNAGMYDILQCTRFLRPVVIGGDDDTRISVAILAG